MSGREVVTRDSLRAAYSEWGPMSVDCQLCGGEMMCSQKPHGSDDFDFWAAEDDDCYCGDCGAVATVMLDDTLGTVWPSSTEESTRFVRKEDR